MTPWNPGLVYMFPSIPLIQQTIVRPWQEQTNALLMAPWWPCQPWFTTLRTISLDFLRLPKSHHLPTQNNGSVTHPDLRSFHFTTWRIHPKQCLSSPERGSPLQPSCTLYKWNVFTIFAQPNGLSTVLITLDTLLSFPLYLFKCGLSHSTLKVCISSTSTYRFRSINPFLPFDP